MHSQPMANGGIAAVPRTPRRRGRSGQNQLAALPDRMLELELNRRSRLAGPENERQWPRAAGGQEIARRREQLGWSQGELARRLGISRSNLQRWEVDALAPDGGEVRALERVLAAGECSPARDPLGKVRSPITLPEYRRGRKPPNAGRKFPAEPLTPEEISALLDALGNGAAGVRDRALVVVLWRSGLRIAEALALYPKDVDLYASSCAILHGKGDRRRVVGGIDGGAVAFLERWLAIRERLGVGPDKPPFCTITRDALGPGRPLASSAFRETLKRAAKRAGIRKRVHPHGLRHSHAFELAMEGVPVPIIQAQLGHVDLSMTQHYIDHLAPMALVNALRDRQWPDALLPPAPPAKAAVMSQGEPAPAPSSPPIPDRVIAGDPATPELAADRGQRAANGKALQRVLDLLAANGGRATQPQITRALGISRARTCQMVAKLHATGLIVGAGFHRESGRPPSKVWRLAPPKASFTLEEPHDPRERLATIARRGYGPQRVLDVIAGLDGRASQAQIARELGVGPTTVAKHCQALEAEGKLTRGGLDKTTSNRGSQVWRLPSPTLNTSPSGWRQVRFAVTPPARTN